MFNACPITPLITSFSVAQTNEGLNFFSELEITQDSAKNYAWSEFGVLQIVNQLNSRDLSVFAEFDLEPTRLPLGGEKLSRIERKWSIDLVNIFEDRRHHNGNAYSDFDSLIKLTNTLINIEHADNYYYIERKPSSMLWSFSSNNASDMDHYIGEYDRHDTIYTLNMNDFDGNHSLQSPTDYVQMLGTSGNRSVEERLLNMELAFQRNTLLPRLDNPHFESLNVAKVLTRREYNHCAVSELSLEIYCENTQGNSRVIVDKKTQYGWLIQSTFRLLNNKLNLEKDINQILEIDSRVYGLSLDHELIDDWKLSSSTVDYSAKNSDAFL